MNFNNPPPPGSIQRINWNTAAVQFLERRFQAFQESGGGGGGGPVTLPFTQIAFGDSSNHLTSSRGLTYNDDPAGGAFAVALANSGGNFVMLDDGLGGWIAGFYDGNGIYFEMDLTNDFFAWGDISHANNNTKIEMDDTLGNISMFSMQKNPMFSFDRDLYVYGDIYGDYNGSRVILNDLNNVFRVDGNRVASFSGISFSGTGVDDLSVVPGSFTGTTADAYNVTIDAINVYQGLVIATMTGTATIGDIVTGTNTGATGTLANAGSLCGDPGCILYVTVISGDFSGETDFTVNTGAFGTLSNVFAKVDTYTWSDNNTSVSGVPCSTSDAILSNGVDILFGATSSHRPGDRWDFSYSFSTGTMLRFDGANMEWMAGDIDGISTGAVWDFYERGGNQWSFDIYDNFGTFLSISQGSRNYGIGEYGGQVFVVDANAMKYVYGNSSGEQLQVNMELLTAVRQRDEPDKDGTYAMLSDIIIGPYVPEVVTTGGTISDGTTDYFYDPPSLTTGDTIIFPANPADGQAYKIHFGGQITPVGDSYVAKTLGFTNNVGQQHAGIMPSSAKSGDSVTVQWRADNSTWYITEMNPPVIDTVYASLRIATDGVALQTAYPLDITTLINGRLIESVAVTASSADACALFYVTVSGAVITVNYLVPPPTGTGNLAYYLIVKLM